MCDIVRKGDELTHFSHSRPNDLSFLEYSLVVADAGRALRARLSGTMSWDIALTSAGASVSELVAETCVHEHKASTVNTRDGEAALRGARVSKLGEGGRAGR